MPIHTFREQMASTVALLYTDRPIQRPTWSNTTTNKKSFYLSVTGITGPPQESLSGMTRLNILDTRYVVAHVHHNEANL